MNKYISSVFVIIIGLVFLSGPLYSIPRAESYRSEATAGFFKAEYDRLSENPAYVGAKLDYLEFHGSITKERNNLYTTMDGLNTDGRLLLGGIGTPNSFGIGGYVELGYQTTPQSISYNPSISNTNVSLIGSGTLEGSDVYLTGPGDYYETRERLYAEEEKYTTDNHINAKVAVGGLQLEDLTFGISLERHTDDLSGGSTGETTDKGGYNYAVERLSDGHISGTINALFDNKTTIEPTNYLLTLGLIIPIGDAIEEIEVEGHLNYLLYEHKENNSGTTVLTDTGNEITTSTYSRDGDNLISDEIESKAMQYGLTVQARKELFEWSATPYFSWISGGISVYEDRTTIYRDSSSTIFPTLSTYESWNIATGTEKYEGDGLVRNQFDVGLLMRKQKENLLIGFGLAFSLTMSEDEFSRTSTFQEVARSDDGDGVDDPTDLTRTDTGYYTDDYTVAEKTQSISIPIGLEYQATPTLCWRLGAIHVTTITTVETKWERTNISDLYRDEDRDDIPGNETDNDGLLNANTSGTQTIGSYSFNTESRGDRDYSKTYEQHNYYYLGLGYAIQNTVQIDVVMTSHGTNYFEIEDMAWDISATYIF
ncbi:MAG: hypothetical protein SVZ03_09430 [Spirochaetota bacterium]|nr:hypothetical protein [Spirochaetota bacterium]